MKRPTTSLYNNRKYDIHWDKGLFGEHDHYGYCKHDFKEMHIDDGLHGFDLADVLMHEVLHQLVHRSGLPVNEDEEENLVNYLGTAIASHMKDNPQLWRYAVQNSRIK